MDGHEFVLHGANKSDVLLYPKIPGECFERGSEDARPYEEEPGVRLLAHNSWRRAEKHIDPLPSDEVPNEDDPIGPREPKVPAGLRGVDRRKSREVHTVRDCHNLL